MITKTKDEELKIYYAELNDVKEKCQLKKGVVYVKVILNLDYSNALSQKNKEVERLKDLNDDIIDRNIGLQQEKEEMVKKTAKLGDDFILLERKNHQKHIGGIFKNIEKNIFSKNYRYLRKKDWEQLKQKHIKEQLIKKHNKEE